jgi:hypothetical protein
MPMKKTGFGAESAHFGVRDGLRDHMEPVAQGHFPSEGRASL